MAQSARRPRPGLNRLPKRPDGQAAPNPIDPNAPVSQCLNMDTTVSAFLVLAITGPRCILVASVPTIAQITAAMPSPPAPPTIDEIKAAIRDVIQVY